MKLVKTTIFVALFLTISCNTSTSPTPSTAPSSSGVTSPAGEAAANRDVHSYSNPEKIRISHIDLDLDVQFERKILKGTATHTLERAADAGSSPLILDTR